MPHLYKTPEEVAGYPVFIKPNQGQGSVGAKKIFNKSELPFAIREEPTSIICEYLPGEEYTVDCFSDREKGLLFVGARVRNKVRNGISVNTQTVDLPEARAYAQKPSERLALHGAWFFQVKRDRDGGLALLEVAPRISGSMAAHKVLGVNFPLLNIYERERIALEVLTNVGSVQLDRALENRYKHNINYSILYWT